MLTLVMVNVPAAGAAGGDKTAGKIEIETAGDENRTHITSLEGWSFTIKLRPLFD
jgi:hypothetical protein